MSFIARFTLRSKSVHTLSLSVLCRVLAMTEEMLKEAGEGREDSIRVVPEGAVLLEGNHRLFALRVLDKKKYFEQRNDLVRFSPSVLERLKCILFGRPLLHVQKHKCVGSVSLSQLSIDLLMLVVVVAEEDKDILPYIDSNGTLHRTSLSVVLGSVLNARNVASTRYGTMGYFERVRSSATTGDGL